MAGAGAKSNAGVAAGLTARLAGPYAGASPMNRSIFPVRVFLLLLAGSMLANAQDMAQLRNGESPDHHYNTLLLCREGKLRFHIIETKGGKTLIDVPSVYEALQKTNPKAVDTVQKVKVSWSPDSRYVIFKEPDSSDAQNGIILVSVLPTGAKEIPIPLDRMKALSAKKHTDWSVEFGDWLGNRMFLLQLYGMTYNPGGTNEHEKIPLVFKIGKKDGDVAILNANE